MSAAKKTIYAALGAGTTVLSKARELPKTLRSTNRLAAVEINGKEVRIAGRRIDLTKVADYTDLSTVTDRVQTLPRRAQEVLITLPGRATTLVERSVELTSNATGRATGFLTELTKRGETLSKRVQRSAPTKRATAQAKTAKSRVKAAGTSVAKAADAATDAVKNAAEKATEASA